MELIFNVLVEMHTIKHLLKVPIVLIGLMGSGKSTLGKKLARKLNLKFYDSDRVIEEHIGLNIVDIYDFKGPEYFKQQEIKVIGEILRYGPVVLSTGGVSLLHKELQQLIYDNAISIWLAAGIDVLYNRVSKRNTRPELNYGNKRETLQQMLTQMQHVCERADIVVQIEEHDAYYIVDSIMSKLRNYLLAKHKNNQ